MTTRCGRVGDTHVEETCVSCLQSQVVELRGVVDAHDAALAEAATTNNALRETIVQIQAVFFDDPGAEFKRGVAAATEAALPRMQRERATAQALELMCTVGREFADMDMGQNGSAALEVADAALAQYDTAPEGPGFWRKS